MMIDTLVANLHQAQCSPLPDRLGLERRDFVYVTLHRTSNVDERASPVRIMDELDSLGRHIPVVFPIHPRTRKMLIAFNIPVHSETKVKLIELVVYHDSLWLTGNSRFVLTDSDGVQEETYYLRTPCLNHRPNTARHVTIEVGTNNLTRLDQLQADIDEILQERSPPGQIPIALKKSVAVCHEPFVLSLSKHKRLMAPSPLGCFQNPVHSSTSSGRTESWKA